MANPIDHVNSSAAPSAVMPSQSQAASTPPLPSFADQMASQTSAGLTAPTPAKPSAAASAFAEQMRERPTEINRAALPSYPQPAMSFARAALSNSGLADVQKALDFDHDGSYGQGDVQALKQMTAAGAKLDPDQIKELASLANILKSHGIKFDEATVPHASQSSPQVASQDRGVSSGRA